MKLPFYLGVPAAALLLLGAFAFGYNSRAAEAPVSVPEEVVGGGTGTIDQLDQWKATSSPYSAITTNVHAKNIYAPFSWATTSGLTATTICFTGDTCRTTWPTGGGGGSDPFPGAATSTALTFNGGITTSSLTVGTLNGGLYAVNGVTKAVATSSVTIGNGLSYTGTMGDVWAGISGTLSATLGTTVAPSELVGQALFSNNGVLSVNTTSGSFFTSATTTLSLTGPFSLSATPVVFGSSPITATYYGLSTSSAGVVSNIPYFTSTSALGNVATTSATINNGLTGTLTTLNSGGSQTIGLATIAANSVLGNVSGSVAVPSAVATSSLFAGTNGQVLARVNGTWTGVATTTYGTGLTYSAGNVTADLGTSIAPSELVGTPGANLIIYTNAAGTGFAGVASSSLSLPNAALQNSTISGIALGANLGDLTAGNTSLTFSGTYNGSTARNIVLNVGNANTWTALQDFRGAASSTLLSATGPFYVGTTSTTTISGTATSTFNGGINVVTGGLRVSTLTSCNTIDTDSNGAFVCGTDEGGAGAVTDKFSTSSADTLAIFANSANRVGLGTSTPKWMLQIASSTGPQLALSDGSLTSDHFTFRSAGNNLYIATSSPSTFGTTTSSTVLAMNRSGGVCFGQSCTAPSTPGEFIFRNQEGTTHYLFMGGNTGGDTDYQIRRFPDNNGLSDDRFSIGTGGIGTLPSEMLTFLPNGMVGVGSTSPWAHFSVASTTWNSYTQPLFRVSTSTDIFGQLFNVTATTSILTGVTPPTGVVSLADGGARVSIGPFEQMSGGLFDNLNFNGRLNTGEWFLYECAGGSFVTGINADTSNVCGNWQYQIDGAGTLLTSTAIIGGYSGTIITNPGTANQGNGLFVAQFLTPGTSTPVMEFAIANALPGSLTVGTTSRYAGFSNLNITTANFEVEPTLGAWIAASSTANNYWVVCKNGSTSMVDTGWSSTTPHYLKFRLEMESSGTAVYMGTPTTTMRLLTTCAAPNSSTFYAPGIYHAEDATGGLSSNFYLYYTRLWFKKPLWQ